MLIILKILCLFLGVIYLYTNTGRLLVKQGVPSGNVILMALGIVGFIVIQFKLY